MKITKILSIAIIAALPFGANAANIQGDMYVAPQPADANHTAPSTDNEPPYGRVNIDTDDQSHIATTAYVKGAYNSAIAGINALDDLKQGRLLSNAIGGPMSSVVLDMIAIDDILHEIESGEFTNNEWEYIETVLPSMAAVVGGIKSQRVKIYTTWDDDRDSATTEVELITASRN